MIVTPDINVPFPLTCDWCHGIVNPGDHYIVDGDGGIMCDTCKIKLWGMMRLGLIDQN